MLRLLSNRLWLEIHKASKKATKVTAAISYFTTDKFINLKEGDDLIVDASDKAVASGETSARVLKSLSDRGVRLFHCRNLHAKAILCDSIAFVGSGNASNFSADHLVEAAIMTNNGNLASACAAFLGQLKKSSDPICANFLSRIAVVLTHWRGRIILLS